MRYLTVVPARGGSTRIPRKNMQRLGFRTLVQIAVDAALDAGLGAAGGVVTISSDDVEILCSHEGATDTLRPAEISGPRADISAAVSHALTVAEARTRERFDEVVTLQPTLPVRPPDLIPQMRAAKRHYGARSALTVMPCVPWAWRVAGDAAANEWSPGPYPRSQDMEYSWAGEVNCVTIADRDVVLAGDRWALPLLLCELPPWAWIDIDTPEDLAEAREWWPVLEHRCMGILKTHLVTRLDRITVEQSAAAVAAGG